MRQMAVTLSSSGQKSTETFYSLQSLYSAVSLLPPTFPSPEATDLIPLHLLSPLEPGVSGTHQQFHWAACKGPQPDRAAVSESWQCSRLCWGEKGAL